MTPAPAAAEKSTNSVMESNCHNSNKKIVPIAVPGIHDKFYRYLTNLLKGFSSPHILDMGAGHGYLVRKLYEDGYNVQAADLFPEYYYYDKVPCTQADLTKPLPFEDQSFDVLIAVEVMEHITSHASLFNEAYRILKPGGLLLFTTPNILSLKSRFRFLFTGFFYSFSPLDIKRNDGLQHLASLTIDQYRYFALREGFSTFDVSFDKKQSTSVWLAGFVPFMWLYCRITGHAYPVHNKFTYLTGRVMFVRLKK